MPTWLLYPEGIWRENQHISQQSLCSREVDADWMSSGSSMRNKHRPVWVLTQDLLDFLSFSLSLSVLPSSLHSISSARSTVSECLSVSITIRRFAFGSTRLGSTPRSLNLREAESQSAVSAAKMKVCCSEGIKITPLAPNPAPPRAPSPPPAAIPGLPYTLTTRPLPASLAGFVELWNKKRDFAVRWLI